MKIH